MAAFTRRELIVASAAAAILPACEGGVGIADPQETDTDAGSDTDVPVDTGWTWEPGPEPTDAWAPPGDEDALAFDCGVQTGDVTPTSALVSVQTRASAVTLRVVRATDAGWEDDRELADLDPVGGTVQVELTDLIPDTTYAVAAFAADGSRSRPARFRTALYPGGSRVVRFGATSCLGGNAPWPTLTFLAAEKLDFFLLLGDTIYADGVPIAPMWREALATRGLQDVTASTSVIGTWDDHELDDNWSWDADDIDARYAEAVAALRAHVPMRQGPGGSGLWRKLAWGDVLDVFVLDSRGERLDGHYLSPEQLQWLKDGLSASTARFKIIVNSVPIIDFTETVLWEFSADDRWQGYPEDRAALLEHVRDAGIEGVLFVAGDLHFGAIGHVDAAGGPGAAIPEVLAGPGGSFINYAAVGIPEGDRFPAILTEWNATLFEADPDAGTVRVVFVDDDGRTIVDHTLSL